ncbi:hypothetical protein RUND412_010164 [Rhizina undulata]
MMQSNPSNNRLAATANYAARDILHRQHQQPHQQPQLQQQQQHLQQQQQPQQQQQQQHHPHQPHPYFTNSSQTTTNNPVVAQHHHSVSKASAANNMMDPPPPANASNSNTSTRPPRTGDLFSIVRSPVVDQNGMVGSRTGNAVNANHRHPHQLDTNAAAAAAAAVAAVHPHHASSATSNGILEPFTPDGGTAVATSPGAELTSANAGLKRKRRAPGGRVPGSQNFSPEDKNALLEIVAAVKPYRMTMWDKVMKKYNRYASKKNRQPRLAVNLHKRFEVWTYNKKYQETDADCPDYIRRAKTIKRQIDDDEESGAHAGGPADDGKDSEDEEEEDAEDADEESDADATVGLPTPLTWRNRNGHQPNGTATPRSLQNVPVPPPPTQSRVVPSTTPLPQNLRPTAAPAPVTPQTHLGFQPNITAPAATHAPSGNVDTRELLQILTTLLSRDSNNEKVLLMVQHSLERELSEARGRIARLEDHNSLLEKENRRLDNRNHVLKMKIMMLSNNDRAAVKSKMKRFVMETDSNDGEAELGIEDELENAMMAAEDEDGSERDGTKSGSGMEDDDGRDRKRNRWEEARERPDS